jgi:AraC-like DNA-binding protein
MFRFLLLFDGPRRATASPPAVRMLLDLPRAWQVAFAHLDVGRGQHEDEAILRAQEWPYEHYHRREVRLEALACRLGMSPRNFIRRFKEATGRTPLAYLQSLRIATAKRLLENGRGTIQEVSAGGRLRRRDVLPQPLPPPRRPLPDRIPPTLRPPAAGAGGRVSGIIGDRLCARRHRYQPSRFADCLMSATGGPSESSGIDPGGPRSHVSGKSGSARV